MTVSFVCRTESVLPREQLFDRARSIDTHLETMAASGERAVAGVTEGLISAGEEVTWGQRQIGFSGPESLTERNQQNETNVHNLLSPWALGATYTVVGVYGCGVGHAVLRRLPHVGQFADLLAPAWRSVAAPWFGVHAVVYSWYSGSSHLSGEQRVRMRGGDGRSGQVTPPV